MSWSLQEIVSRALCCSDTIDHRVVWYDRRVRFPSYGRKPKCQGQNVEVLMFVCLVVIKCDDREQGEELLGRRERALYTFPMSIKVPFFAIFVDYSI